MRVLGDYLKVDRTLYAEIEPNDEYFVIADNYVRGNFPKMVGRFPLSDFGQAAKSQRLGETLVWPDVNDTGESEAHRAAYLNIGVRSIMGIPLHKDGRWVASLTVHYSSPRQWTPEEVAFVSETAERTWAAVERARAEAAMRESEIQRIQEQSAREEERLRAVREAARSASLAELDRTKTLFFSNISHEFRTPLTLLLAPLQDALSDRSNSLPSVQQDRLELAHRNGVRLLKLVNTLLDFSRIEAGRMEAIYEPTDLAQLTMELASVFQSTIEQAGLRFVVDCPPLPELVYVDRQMWEKIVLNLLSNAFKFTFCGEITVSLSAELTGDPQTLAAEFQTLTNESQILADESQILVDDSQSLADDSQSLANELQPLVNESQILATEFQILADDSQPLANDSQPLVAESQSLIPQARVLLKIRDTGTGIAPEHLPHLFERFYQVRETQARSHEGSGIGLALVAELVKLQGGTIAVSSTLGEGTCFTIALPLGVDHLPPDQIQASRPSTCIETEPYVQEAEFWRSGDRAILNQAQILLVDDNADMRDYLTRILGDQVQVEAVADGEAALLAARSRTPDLILSDVMMPGLNGFQLLQALRTDSRTKDIPIVLLSARAGAEAIAEGLKAGADDYLIKPFSAQELISRITAHLQSAQRRGEALQQERVLNRQKDELISVVSHELNAPLVSILGWTRMLRSYPFNPEMLTKALNTIERNATLQAKLVQDLLDISRITVGKLHLNPQPIELRSVIETAIATVAQTAIDKGVHLTWQENATKPVVVMGDRDRLHQVLINLLTNAIKFTPDSGSVTLELSSDASNHAEIRVTDTGVGVTADFLPHVFDRFRQAEDANVAKGLGLGLAIARHIVELHNGTIKAESAGEDQGATFVIRLPRLATTRDEDYP
ncbi:response regulator [Cyanobacteria bacterium FACHB-63]|nr:response regulator [Cyanobacteria bacterium FACHB-63]